MKELFLELFSEEIPAKMQLNACAELKKRLIEEFEGFIKYEDIQTFVTPRRLVAKANIAEYTNELSTEFRGPKGSATRDIVEKFALSRNTLPENCYKKTTNSGEYWFFTEKTPAQPVDTVLGEIITNVILKFKWPKTMVWNSGHIKWIRPLRNVFVCLNQHSIPINIMGIGNSEQLQGHRTLGGKFTAKTFDEYKKALADNYVILDFYERLQIILDQIKGIEKTQDISVGTNEDLLTEITGLVEYPRVILGEIPLQFLSLPAEVIINCIGHHQKFLPVFKDEKLAPLFISVSNSQAIETFTQGNQKVLNARLSDADFFFKNDHKIPLSERFEKLDSLLFYHNLGSVKDRTNRIRSIAAVLSKYLSLNQKTLDRAAYLSKCDLMTEMVYEFPELQGVIASKYAELDNEDLGVCLALREQYLPQGNNDMPTSIYGAALALADKLELLISMFSIGKKLSGSKDPMGLRRAGIGIVKIILDKEFYIDLLEVIEKVKPEADNLTIIQYFTQFILDRLVQILQCPTALINAVFSAWPHLNLVELTSRIKMAQRYYQDENIIASYKRLSNSIANNKKTGNVDETLFQEQAEHQVYNIAKELNNCQDMEAQMQCLQKYSNQINQFFDEVLVNTEDEIIRKNRINLILEVLQGYEQYIKFALLF